MFPSMDPWEIALWLVATYVAVVSLVRLMAHHRDRLVDRLREQLRSERREQAQNILARKRRAAALKQNLSSQSADR